MKPALVSQMFDAPPNWKHMKFAGNGPATSSENATCTGDLGVLASAAPPASAIEVDGFERSIVV